MKKSAYVLFTMILAIGASGSGCSGYTGGPDDAKDEQIAAINFQLKVPGPDADTDKPYTTEVEWQGELISSSSSAGEANPFAVTKTYDGYVGTGGDIIVSELVLNKRPGTWHFKVFRGAWIGECIADLLAGNITSVNFTFEKDGCETGFQFP